MMLSQASRDSGTPSLAPLAIWSYRFRPLSVSWSSIAAIVGLVIAAHYHKAPTTIVRKQDTILVAAQRAHTPLNLDQSYLRPLRRRRDAVKPLTTPPR